MGVTHIHTDITNVVRGRCYGFVPSLVRFGVYLTSIEKSRNAPSGKVKVLVVFVFSSDPSEANPMSFVQMWFSYRNLHVLCSRYYITLYNMKTYLMLNS